MTKIHLNHFACCCCFRLSSFNHNTKLERHIKFKIVLCCMQKLSIFPLPSHAKSERKHCVRKVSMNFDVFQTKYCQCIWYTFCYSFVDLPSSVSFKKIYIKLHDNFSLYKSDYIAKSSGKITKQPARL